MLFRSVRQLVAVAIVLLAFGAPVLALGVSPEVGPFQDTWDRTDLPVRDGIAPRTWMWGPEGFTFVQAEPYAGAPDGQRMVQYFDKSRMEINDPGADPESPWFVTNGLLVNELMSGWVQLGDDQFEQREPAQVNVAGDYNDPNGPTYATFAGVLDADPLPVGEGDVLVGISWAIDREGNVVDSKRWGDYGVTTAYHDEVTNHTIARPFWQFMNATGIVYEAGEFVEDALFESPFYATGRPVTEAYWAEVLVAGQPTDVLIQCFERRCLTYTPSNPEGWQVEAGNVGRHYYDWRYGGTPGRIAFSYEGDIWIMEGDGSDPVRLTSGIDGDSLPVLSPNGERLLFVRIVSGGSPSSTGYELRVIDADGTDELMLASLGTSGTSSGVAPSFDWSLDGTRVAFNAASSEATINVINADGSGLETLTEGLGGASLDLDWSPTDERIVFKHYNTPGDDTDPETGLYVVDADTGNVEQLTTAGFEDVNPQWSPDGARIAFDRGQAFPTRSLYIMDAGGGEAAPLVDTQGAGSARWSPDGASIAYVAESRLWVAPAGGGEPQMLTPDIFVGEDIAWSPDSGYVVFTGPGVNGPLSSISAEGDSLHTLIADGGWTVDWGS